MNWVLIGPIGSFLWWMITGLSGRFESWPSNVVILQEPSSYIITQGKKQDTRKIWQHEKDQQTWLQAGFVTVFVIIFLAIFFP